MPPRRRAGININGQLLQNGVNVAGIYFFFSLFYFIFLTFLLGTHPIQQIADQIYQQNWFNLLNNPLPPLPNLPYPQPQQYLPPIPQPVLPLPPIEPTLEELLFNM